MYNLSYIGRQWICRKIGMPYKSNNIFIKKETAFNDRMDLLNIVYNIDKMVELYEDELSNFSSEIEYNEYLNSSLLKLAIDVRDKISTSKHIVDLMIDDRNDCFKRARNFESIIDTKNYLRVYFDYPIYEGFKYMCMGLYDVKSTAYDYIYSVTNSKFLAYASDISIPEGFKGYINHVMVLLAASIFSLLSPKLLNVKELKYIGKSEVIYVSAYNKSVTQLDNIINILRNNKEISLENANIELYTIKQLAANNSISEKVSLTQEDLGINHKIINCDELTFLAYLRKRKNEPRSGYDKYFNYKGNLARLQLHLKIDWI